MGLIIFLCHWVGTFYHILAQIEDFYGIEDNWLRNIGKFEFSWYDRYVESFYWGIATFLLVGSKGDTLYETIYCILVLLITIGLFAYILSSIS